MIKQRGFRGINIFLRHDFGASSEAPKYVSKSLLLLGELRPISFFAAGGGHGNMNILLFIFPYASLLTKFTDNIQILIIVAVLQFPTYGLILDFCKFKFKKINATILILLAIHIITIIVADSKLNDF